MNEKYCPRCNKYKLLTEFYQRRKKSGKTCYCKSCLIADALSRQLLFKQQCLAYKGGKCVICGYNSYHGALEFHHLRRSEKKCNISRLRSHKFSDFVKSELDKCLLVCGNCHREIEGGIISIENYV